MEGNSNQTSSQTDPDPFEKETCSQCHKIFFNSKNKKRHLKTQHLGQKRIPCNECDKTYASTAALQYHVGKCHSHNKVPSYSCKHCDQQFANFETFNIHSRMHKKVVAHKCRKCYSCSKCTFRTKRKHHLQKHIAAVHATEITTLYECTFCDNRYNSKDNLTRHKKKSHPSHYIR